MGEPVCKMQPQTQVMTPCIKENTFLGTLNKKELSAAEVAAENSPPAPERSNAGHNQDLARLLAGAGSGS
ncbi:MAG: hypothetical protein U1F57_04585 [bacterium]